VNKKTGILPDFTRLFLSALLELGFPHSPQSLEKEQLFNGNCLIHHIPP
jgi:hypothetical protein